MVVFVQTVSGGYRRTVVTDVSVGWILVEDKTSEYKQYYRLTEWGEGVEDGKITPITGDAALNKQIDGLEAKAKADQAKIAKLEKLIAGLEKQAENAARARWDGRVISVKGTRECDVVKVQLDRNLDRTIPSGHTYVTLSIWQPPEVTVQTTDADQDDVPGGSGDCDSGDDPYGVSRRLQEMTEGAESISDKINKDVERIQETTEDEPREDMTEWVARMKVEREATRPPWMTTCPSNRNRRRRLIVGKRSNVCMGRKVSGR
jgi:hypothetical protein